MRFTCLHKRENPDIEKNKKTERISNVLLQLILLITIEVTDLILLENKTVEFFSIELLLLIDTITSERSSVESFDVNYKIGYLSIIF